MTFRYVCPIVSRDGLIKKNFFPRRRLHLYGVFKARKVIKLPYWMGQEGGERERKREKGKESAREFFPEEISILPSLIRS